MARPRNKAELLAQSQGNFEKLINFVEGYSDEEQKREFPAGTLNRNIRDVLAHLYHWHLMFLRWYEEGMAGKKPAIPAEGYTWKTTPELNRKIRENYAQEDLNKVKKLLGKSHKELYALIQKHEEEELFEKKKYKWTGTTSLAAYLISATSSHYDWAWKLIRKAKK